MARLRSVSEQFTIARQGTLEETRQILIRTAKDSGHVCILDNRILTKRYGKLFLNALPDAPVEIVG